jgi:choline-sulfatase
MASTTRLAVSTLASAAKACAVVTLVTLWIPACMRSDDTPTPDRAVRPSILLVTLDTTRADTIGPEARGVETPSFNSLAARGMRFRRAYATVPETLPSHSSLMTGLYPAAHGVHENGRFLPSTHPVLAERLHQAGYRTAAFVSSFILARRFGLGRGFDVYDDQLTTRGVERPSAETTNAVVRELHQPSSQPRFVWVHYNDPHHPYTPPEPFRTKYSQVPYLGEVAAMDEQLGRLVRAFEEQQKGPIAIIVVADHGEGLGEHGESQHGNLLYDSTMRVPLVVVGPGVSPGVSETPVSSRRVFGTVLDWAGVEFASSLRGEKREIVLGEAMKPYLEFGWRPQTMAIEGRYKALSTGRLEVYDLVADPSELHDLGSGANLTMEQRKTIDEYPVPPLGAARQTTANLDDEARRRLASLGYVTGGAMPVVRKDAPRPVDMVGIFDVIEKASSFFVDERYADAIPLFEAIVARDPQNLDAILRLATAHSALGHDARAIDGFRRAAAVAPQSPDVRLYLALHLARGKDWERAIPPLEQVVAETPERVPALEALAMLRERQGRAADAIRLRQTIHRLREPTPAELVHLGALAMSVQQTPLAIESFERARERQPGEFGHNLELGVLYLDARRLPQARDALDRVPRSSPDYPMALFKRAQVSVLLDEPDRAARIELARRHANGTTRELIARERLFGR